MLLFNISCVPALIWFLLEGLDSVSGIMENVAVMAADELKDQGTVILIPSFLRSLQPLMGVDSSFSYPYSFLSDRSFESERERQQLCQRVQFIYLRSPLSFLVPSYPCILSIAGLHADGTHCFLDNSVAEDGTLADTSPSFLPTY